MAKPSTQRKSSVAIHTKRRMKRSTIQDPPKSGFTANSSTLPRISPKTPNSYLPETKVLAIQRRYIRGENRTSIAHAEGVDRGTVARIVQFPEVRAFIAHQQQEFFGLVPDAMAAIRHALQATKDPKVGFQILQATGVAPQRGERLATEEAQLEGISRQALLVASVLLEGRKNMSVDLPPDLAKVIKKSGKG
jgi:hypothetical protein